MTAPGSGSLGPLTSQSLSYRGNWSTKMMLGPPLATAFTFSMALQLAAAWGRSTQSRSRPGFKGWWHAPECVGEGLTQLVVKCLPLEGLQLFLGSCIGNGETPHRHLLLPVRCCCCCSVHCLLCLRHCCSVLCYCMPKDFPAYSASSLALNQPAVTMTLCAFVAEYAFNKALTSSELQV